MASELKKNINCEYCGAKYQIRYQEDLFIGFCVNCSEALDNDEEDEDLDEHDD